MSQRPLQIPRKPKGGALHALGAFALHQTPVVLFVLVLVVFSALDARFLSVDNFVNILVQSAVLLIGAVGMTFVLLTAGVDLSVGAIMFLAAVPAGKLVLEGHSPLLALLAALLVGVAFGAVNALFTVRLRVMAFVVTLSTLYVGRGLGLFITQTRAMNLPEELTAVGAFRVFGVPLPALVAGVVAVVGHLVLTRSRTGRQIYALGNDADASRKAGLPVDRLRGLVFVISGFCAGLAGFVAIAQVGVVTPTMGNQRELSIIAAAVLGGTSLFGGRGGIWPGTVVGALLMTTIEAGLNILNVDPYLYPLLTAAIIFGAVAVDSLRNLAIARRNLRRIRPWGATIGA